jgi:hypothetical protein
LFSFLIGIIVAIAVGIVFGEISLWKTNLT